MNKSAILTLLLSASASAFVPSAKCSVNTQLPSKINPSIDLSSPKVVNQETLNPGDKKVFCRCWRSGTFPLCDGSHVAHNKETGDNVGPLIVSVAKEQ